MEVTVGTATLPEEKPIVAIYTASAQTYMESYRQLNPPILSPFKTWACNTVFLLMFAGIIWRITTEFQSTGISDYVSLLVGGGLLFRKQLLNLLLWLTTRSWVRRGKSLDFDFVCRLESFPDKYVIKTNIRLVEIPWTAISKAKITPLGTGLYASPSEAYWNPASAFESPEEYSRFLALVREKVKTVEELN